MGKQKRKSSQSFMVPLVTYRTPEQHRAIIQPKKRETSIVVAFEAVARPVKLAKAGIGATSLGARLSALGIKRYSQYLGSRHWQDVKRRWKDSKLYQGWVCHSANCRCKRGLSFHHRTYERLGREELSDIILVCENCHKKIHRLERSGLPLLDATARVTGAYQLSAA